MDSFSCKAKPACSAQLAGRRRDAAVAAVAAACLLLGSMGSSLAQTPVVDPAPGATQQGTVHIVPFGRGSGSFTNTAAPAGAHLTYWGGPVISQIHVIAVFWGTNVNTAVTGGIGQFFTDITKSSYYDLLAEYSTTGVVGSGVPSASTNQAIARGQFDGAVTIVPSVACTVPCTLTDAQIQTELAAQITGGHLPQPLSDATGNFETFYMIYFPPGVTISLDPKTNSCLKGGFCAYHSNLSTNVPYGVLPDFAPPSGCATGCGAGTVFQNVTAVTSHEMAEAVTDALVGSAVLNGPPLAWYDPDPATGGTAALGEIGDICSGQDVPVNAGANSYTVQQEFSNLQNDCVSAPPKFTASAPAAGIQGVAFNLTLTVQSSVNSATLTGYLGTVHFSSSDALAVLPADYTFTAADAGTHTFPVTLKAAGSQTITATDINAAAFTGSATLIVGGPAADLQPLLFSAAGTLNQGQTNAGYTVVISNQGSLSSSGTVTVTNTLSAGLTATAISGTGWTCTLATLTCTRADALAVTQSFPAITVTFNVANNAPANSSATIKVSGGGDSNPGNNTATFTATVTPTIAIALTNPGPQVVNAGTPASYNLALTLAPAAGTVAFACTGLPNGAACSFSPTSLTASGAEVVTISTTARSAAVPLAFRIPSGGAPLVVLLLLVLASLAASGLGERRLRRKLAFAGAGLLIFCVFGGCGGGGSSTTSTVVQNPNGTPAGTFAVTVTATGSSSTASQPLTLIVR